MLPLSRLKLWATLRGGGPELAVELLDQALAVLVPLLVLADRADLHSGEAVEAVTDLLDVQLIVAGDRERGARDLTFDEAQTLLVVGQRRVQQVRVSVNGLANQRLESVALLLGPLD